MTDEAPNGQAIGSALAAGLYIVATPLGHARDITLRALDVLAAADMIYCEDTRNSAKLLAYHGIKTPTAAYHEHNGAKARPENPWRLGGRSKTCAYFRCRHAAYLRPRHETGARRARRRPCGDRHSRRLSPDCRLVGIRLAQRPLYLCRFLPPKSAARQSALENLKAARGGTLVVFEAARRLPALLDDIAAVYGACDICVARELTKKFEEVKADRLMTAGPFRRSRPAWRNHRAHCPAARDRHGGG